MATIPINVISLNNYKYVAMMLLQLTSLLVDPNITIVDNGSTDQYTLNYLSTLSYPVKYLPKTTPVLWYYIYDPENVPDIFAVTDADLLFNEDMPNTFLDDLILINSQYGSWQTGMALRIDDPSVMYQYSFDQDYCGYPNVYEIWTSQSQFWNVQYVNSNFDIYEAAIDSTFFIFNKNNNGNPSIRVGGIYQQRVISWYERFEDLSSVGGGSLSGISRLHRYFAHVDDYPDVYYPIRCFELHYLAENNIIAVSKDISPDFSSVGQITHLVQLDLQSTGSDSFWETVYPTNYNPIFEHYNTYLNPSKDYIDIGSWLGDTIFYPSRNSKRVILVEPDSRVRQKLKNTIHLSFMETPFLVEESALYSSTSTSATFCQYPNPESESTLSHLSSSCTGTEVSVSSISFSDLISKYSITDVSFINCNINGDEENVIEVLHTYSSTNSVPLYVTFYYSIWNNQDLNRFTFLTTEQKTLIQSGVVSILFV